MNTQTSLENWISIKSIKKEIPNIFYLDWNNDLSYPNKQAVWLNDMPENYNFKNTIYWKDFRTNITICGNLNYNNFFNYLEYPNMNDISYIKSHIQKSIRRNLDQHCVKSSMDYIKLDFNDFLRRLPIIMIEDVYAHKSINTIIWMMLAFNSTKTIKEEYNEFINIYKKHLDTENKNSSYNNSNNKSSNKLKKIIYNKWIPTTNQISWILGVVSLLSRTNNRIILNEKYKIEHTFNYKLNKENIKKISNKYSSLLYSIMLRKSYGGMKNDMIMLNNYLNYYYNILIKKDFFIKYKKIYLEPIKSIDINVKNLNKDEWLVEAMDFHCKPNIISSLYNNFFEEDYQYDDIKKAIWYNCSGINYKNNLIIDNDINNNINNNINNDINNDINNYNEIWENIKKYFSLCYFHKSSLFN